MTGRSKCMALMAVSTLTLMIASPSRGASFSIVYTFGCNADAGYPDGPLLYRDGLLYGTSYFCGANSNGTVFQYDPVSGQESVLRSLSPTGYTSARTGVALYKGRLYGTLSYGGPSNDGAAFKVNRHSGFETLLGAFGPSSSAIVPGHLTDGDDALFGTTASGGDQSVGSIFRVDPTTGAITTVYSFKGGADGAGPGSRLLHHDGVFYGTTHAGGPQPKGSGDGTIFQYDPVSGIKQTIYSFKDGISNPGDGVIYSANHLYGVTQNAKHAGGSIFGFDLKSGRLKVLYKFGSNGNGDAYGPTSRVTFLDGCLYGTSPGGGSTGAGTIFKLDLASGKESVVYSFPHNYYYGTGGELTDVNGVLYGTTVQGGPSYAGYIFKFTP